MVYYKIPLSGGLKYPAGCILCCAYTYNGYIYCKFERVTSVGSGWIQITQSEFDVRCPEFPTPGNTGGSSSSQVQTEIESTEYPGCFYRMVNGKKEWRNPPMIPNTEYRTAERYNGMPVYTKLLRKSFNVTGDGETHEIGTYPLGAAVIELRGIKQTTEDDGLGLFHVIPNLLQNAEHGVEYLHADNLQNLLMPDLFHEGYVSVCLPVGETYTEDTIFSVTIKYIKQ